MLVIGDVHGKEQEYLKLIEGHETSIQIGDMGFSYEHIPSGHLFFKGNHDNYDIKSPNDLGDFGPVPNLPHSFFVRGGYSIDQKDRVIGVSWWEQEELSYQECLACLELYKELQPKVVLSHECPSSVHESFRPPFSMFSLNLFHSKTARLLQAMLEEHVPDIWIFGHHHQSLNMYHEGCIFICLNELETIEI